VAPARHWHQIKPKNRPASKRNQKLRNLGRLCVTTAVDRNSDMKYEISSAKSSAKLGDDPLFSLSTELLSRMAFPAQGRRQDRHGRLQADQPVARGWAREGIAETLAADVKGFVSREAN